MQSQLKSFVTNQATEANRGDTIRQIEAAFAKTLMRICQPSGIYGLTTSQSGRVTAPA